MTRDADALVAEELRELHATFCAQAGETLEETQNLLVRLEAEPGAGAALLPQLQRFLHTLKGDSGSIGLASFSALCHALEDVAAATRGAEGGRRDALLALLFAGVDELRRLLASAAAGSDPAADAELLARIGREAAGEEAAPPRGLTEYERLHLETLRGRGLPVHEVRVGFHPGCGERAVGALMLRRRLAAVGEVVAALPDPEREGFDAVEEAVFLVGGGDPAALEAAAALPGVGERVAVAPLAAPGAAPAPAAAPAPPADPAAPAAAAAPGQRGDLLRIEAAKVDQVMDLVGELIIGRSMIEQLGREVRADSTPQEVEARLQAVHTYLDRTVSDLQKRVMAMRMVTVQGLFRRFPRVVRDLARRGGKRARLATHGADTELDKALVEALAEPLVHLVRNSVDHGIETPEQRRGAGKPEEGVVTLRAYREASQIVVEVSDDGRGIDTARLRARAAAGGHLDREAAGRLGEAEALDLVFLPGLSTAPTLSESSGRGVGMDAVRRAVAEIKGTVEVLSEPGRGATFRLRLPLTLAVVRCLHFEVGGHLFAVPVDAIAEVARVREGDVATLDGHPVLRVRDQIVSLVVLERLFGFAAAPAGRRFVLILAGGGRRSGFLIDRLLWQQELVIKAVDERHLGSDLVAGASILGDGRVVLILDAAAMLRKAHRDARDARGEP